MLRRSPRIYLILVFSGICLITGCFGNLAKRLADKETYGIVNEKQKEALGKVKPFSIDQTTTSLTREVTRKAGYSSDQFSTRSLSINLSDALALAIDNNNEYQSNREQVYLSALRLTDARHRFSPIFSETVAAKATRRPGADRVTGTALTGIKVTPTVERFGEAASNFAVTKLFATGAQVSVGLTNNFLRYYTGTPRPDTATGLMTASVIQPLLQGAGTLVTLENLRQSDRDVIYALRTFERYQRRFVLERITQYYRLLQAFNEIDNEFQAYRRLVVARERAQAMVEDGQRLAAFQVDQAMQDEIGARNRWLTARTQYALQLDKFKVDLGLPPELNIQPDPAELAKVQTMSLVELKYDLSTAERLAMEQRLDYKTALNRAEDAARKVRIAENSLLPAVNAQANMSLPDEGKNQPLDLDWKRRTYSAGMSVELPLDRKGERNTYRTALIAREAARRNAEQLRNSLIAEVRESYQNVTQARQSYDIQVAGLKLAERRVDNVQMLLDVGREEVNIRDQLEAQAALRDARNSVTQVLIDYVISRLEFYHAIEALEINDRGIWKDESATRHS